MSESPISSKEMGEKQAAVGHDELVSSSDPSLMNEAFDGEHIEHQTTAWEAVKQHPWACFWAFIMCFTIVSSRTSIIPLCCTTQG